MHGKALRLQTARTEFLYLQRGDLMGLGGREIRVRPGYVPQDEVRSDFSCGFCNRSSAPGPKV